MGSSTAAQLEHLLVNFMNEQGYENDASQKTTVLRKHQRDQFVSVIEFAAGSLELILTPHFVRDHVERMNITEVFSPENFKQYGPVIREFLDEIYSHKKEFVVRYPTKRDGSAKELLPYEVLRDIRHRFMQRQIEGVIHPNKDALNVVSMLEPQLRLPQRTHSSQEFWSAPPSQSASGINILNFQEFMNQYGRLPYVALVAESDTGLSNALQRITLSELNRKRIFPESYIVGGTNAEEYITMSECSHYLTKEPSSRSWYRARLARDAVSGHWVAAEEPMLDVHYTTGFRITAPEHIAHRQDAAFEVHLPNHPTTLTDEPYLPFRHLLLRLSADLLRQTTLSPSAPLKTFSFNTELLDEEIHACIPRINYAVTEGLPSHLVQEISPIAKKRETGSIVLEAIVDAAIGKVTYAIRDANKEGYYLATKSTGCEFLLIENRVISDIIIQGMPCLKKIAYGLNNHIEEQYHLLWVPNEADPKTSFANAAKEVLSLFFTEKGQYLFFKKDRYLHKGFYSKLVSSVQHDLSVELLSPTVYAKEQRIPLGVLHELMAPHEVLKGIFAIPLQKLEDYLNLSRPMIISSPSEPVTVPSLPQLIPKNNHGSIHKHTIPPRIQQKLNAYRGNDVMHLYDYRHDWFPLMQIKSTGTPALKVCIAKSAFVSYVHEYALAPSEEGKDSAYHDEMLYTWGVGMTSQKKVPLNELCRLFAIDQAYGALRLEVEAAIDGRQRELLTAENGRIRGLDGRSLRFMGKDMYFMGRKTGDYFVLTRARIQETGIPYEVLKAYQELFQGTFGTSIIREVGPGIRDRHRK